MNQLDKERLESNLLLVNLLKDIIIANPSQRFGQILRNYGFVKEIPDYHPEILEIIGYIWQNEFNSESSVILERVRKTLEKGG